MRGRSMRRAGGRAEGQSEWVRVRVRVRARVCGYGLGLERGAPGAGTQLMRQTRLRRTLSVVFVARQAVRIGGVVLLTDVAHPSLRLVGRAGRGRVQVEAVVLRLVAMVVLAELERVHLRHLVHHVPVAAHLEGRRRRHGRREGERSGREVQHGSD